MLHQGTASQVVAEAPQQENEVLKLLMNSLQPKIRKAVVKSLGALVDILL